MLLCLMENSTDKGFKQELKIKSILCHKMRQWRSSFFVHWFDPFVMAALLCLSCLKCNDSSKTTLHSVHSLLPVAALVSCFNPVFSDSIFHALTYLYICTVYDAVCSLWHWSMPCRVPRSQLQSIQVLHLLGEWQRWEMEFDIPDAWALFAVARATDDRH
jgi:hypothetical protein